MVSSCGIVKSVFLIVLDGKIFLHTEEDKGVLLCCCSSSTFMVDKDSSQSDGAPAKQKCTLNQGSLSYLAFISASTKFTDGESIFDSTDANHIWDNGIFSQFTSRIEVFLHLSYINCT